MLRNLNAMEMKELKERKLEMKKLKGRKLGFGLVRGCCG